MHSNKGKETGDSIPQKTKYNILARITRNINGVNPTSMKGTGSYDKNPVHPRRKQPQRNKKMRQNMHDQTTKTNLSLKTDPSNMIIVNGFSKHKLQ